MTKVASILFLIFFNCDMLISSDNHEDCKQLIKILTKRQKTYFGMLDVNISSEKNESITYIYIRLT